MDYEKWLEARKEAFGTAGCQLALHPGGREGNSLGPLSKWHIGYGEGVLILDLNERRGHKWSVFLNSLNVVMYDLAS